MTDDVRKRSAREDGAARARSGERGDRRQSTNEPHEHYSPFAASFDLGDATEQEAAVIRSRAAECPVCQAALDQLDSWLEVLQHTDPRVGPEFVTRHHFLSRLLGVSEDHQGRLSLVDLDELYHHWGLGTLLVEESTKHRNAQPDLALQLAELAEAVASTLDTAFYGEEHVAALRARSAACLGHSCLAVDRLDLAEEQVQSARDWLRLAPQSPAARSDVGTLVERLAEVRDMRRRRSANPRSTSKPDR